jgi:integrase
MQGKITKYQVDKLTPREKDQFLWDPDVKGFGLKCTPTGKKVYILQYRVFGSSTAKRFTIGPHGTYTPETARQEAKGLLGDIAKGIDPADNKAKERQAQTLKTFAAHYLADYAELHKKPRSAAEDDRNLKKHILPILGSRPVDKLNENDMERLHLSLKDIPIAANRCLSLLSNMMNWAEKKKIRPKRSNPCYGITRYKETKRKRYLSADELARLGEALRDAEHSPTHSPFMLAALRLLLFTGCRKDEILSLKWEYINFQDQQIHFPDSKTGHKTIPLNPPAFAILESLPRLEGNPFVLCGRRLGKRLVNVHQFWVALREKAKLQDVRLHDLRHSFASVGAGLQLGLPMIGGLLGHTQASTTARYAHLANDPLKAASNLISQRVAESLEASAPKPEQNKPRRRLRLVDK